jgi:hypothetical protein
MSHHPHLAERERREEKAMMDGRESSQSCFHFNSASLAPVGGPGPMLLRSFHIESNPTLWKGSLQRPSSVLSPHGNAATVINCHSSGSLFRRELHLQV